MKTNPVVTELRGIEAATDRIIAERDQLREQNKELVNALKLTLKLLEVAGVVEGVAQQSARAILAKIT